MKTALVTGSSGLIGSEAVTFLDERGFRVIGLDNNMRRDFFGPAGDTTWNLERLRRATSRFEHHDVDVRDRKAILGIVAEARPDLVVHSAAQPSHDLAASRPFDDFEVNAVGTLNVLEAVRQSSPESPFVFISTNKESPRVAAVYNLGGGRANSISVLEAIEQFEERFNLTLQRQYVDEPRRGDHICYISDLAGLKADYPGWEITISLDEILDQLARLAAPTTT